MNARAKATRRHNKPRPFKGRQRDGKLEVWDGPPDGPESNIVMVIDEALVPAMIACLRNTPQGKRS